jgi:hypothetical protein
MSRESASRSDNRIEIRRGGLLILAVLHHSYSPRRTRRDSAPQCPTPLSDNCRTIV